MKINYVLSHPIQYQSPLIKYLSKNKIDIKVSYRSNISVNKFYDKDFRQNIKWDVNLLSGYKYKFLRYIGPNRVSHIFPLTIDLFKILKDKNSNIIWVHGCKNWFNLLIILLGKIYNKKIFLRDEVHHFSKKRSIFNKIFNFIYYFLVNYFVDCFLAIGEANKKYYIDNFISQNKIILVPYVVDNEYFTLKKKNNIKSKTIFLFASKLQHKKGIDILLEAIKNINKNEFFVKRSEFWVIGNGELNTFCKNFIKNNNIKNVKLLGFQNQRQLRSFYHKSDVLILPSRFEPWGLVINEAMAAGNAIIASHKVGAGFDLVNNKNGKIFESENIKDLQNKIIYFINNKKNISFFKKNSLLMIKKFSFAQCLIGIKQALTKIQNNL